jgi:hypothetical protein
MQARAAKWASCAFFPTVAGCRQEPDDNGESENADVYVISVSGGALRM